MNPYQEIADDIANLVHAKNQAYGDSFGKSGDVLKILYPNGIGVSQLDSALFVIRVLDKLFRIATDNDPTGETPSNDITGYGFLEIHRLAMERQAKVPPPLPTRNKITSRPPLPDFELIEESDPIVEFLEFPR